MPTTGQPRPPPADFHPLITQWFGETYGRPTAVQEAAWPLIRQGEHVLALAPTGSGKTLTAFLAALDRLAAGVYPADRLSVLYLSPLKALNEDIRRNLLEPLGAIRSRFLAAGLPFPAIRVETRSGDTPPSERRRFLAKPPSILALTPESLAILLLNPRGREVLQTVRYLIMDEIHAVLGNKRGSFLACQVDRLALLAGEFQRISLSATVRPPEAAAAFAGGLRRLDPAAPEQDREPRYEARPVRIVAPPAEKQIDFRVEFPPDETEDQENPQSPDSPSGEPRKDRYGRRYTALINYLLHPPPSGPPKGVLMGAATPEIPVTPSGEEGPSRAAPLDAAAAEEGASPLKAPSGPPSGEGGPLKTALLGGAVAEERAPPLKAPPGPPSGEGGPLKTAPLGGAAAEEGASPLKAPPGPQGLGPGRGTVLVFTDSRRRAERISYLLNEAAGRTVAFTHHGSLSRELRREVERALAAGQLPCVVATASLELGIDIGAVDEVILAGSPQTAAQTLQRIGRSGHGVGQLSRGRLLPFNGADLLLAAALAQAVENRDIEEIRPIENPLDVLAQTILALCAEKDREEEELFRTLRGFFPFKTLSREAFRGVVGMLSGRFAGSRLRELKPRLYRDQETGVLSAPSGTLPLLYASGGVITGRGYYSLRLADGTRIGELDEEFVWERRLGDAFDFGSRPWRITAISAEAVEVVPLEKSADYAPFWKAESAFRSPLLARRVLEFLDHWEENLGGEVSPLAPALRSSATPLCGAPPRNAPRGFQRGPDNGRISPGARDALREFIVAQKRIQGQVPLPGTASLPVEIIDDPSGRGDSWPVVLHSFRGAALNYPLSMALAQDLENRLGTRVETLADDNALLLRLPRQSGEEPEALIRQSLARLEAEGGRGWEGPFRERFESSGTFGAMFREAAERSLLLPRAFFGKRTPLWIMRQRSKRLFDAVRDEPDFPLTAEAWRTCLTDLFDLEGLQALIGELREGTVKAGFFRTPSGSPFARDLLWKETNVLMYQYDERPDLPRRQSPAAGPGPLKQNLTDQVIAEALDRPRARPPIPGELAGNFSARLRRELAGWAPEDPRGLSEWVKERIAIPLDEWEGLRAVLPPELRETLDRDPSLEGRIGPLSRPGAALPAMVHREWAELWREDPLAQLGPWLRYQGPLSAPRIAAVFGAGAEETEAALEELAGAGELVRDLTLEGERGLCCDRENFDFLLRLVRRKARPQVKERPASLLVPYLALRQGIVPRGPGGGAAPPAGRPWEKLAGYPAPAKLWETDLFPAREGAYTGEALERAVREGRLLWYGAGKERIAFAPPEDLELFLPAGGGQGEGPLDGLLSSGYFDIPRDFWALREAAGLDAPSGVRALWEAVWEGRLSADSWEPVRRGIDGGFSLPALPEPAAPQAGPSGRGRRLPRALRDRWRTGPPVRGNWFSLDGGEAPEDESGGPGEGGLLDAEELNRDRVRALIARWGVLCRPLLEREEPALSWSRLLPAIRRLELAGELAAGRFFAGINSLQFASPGVAAELEAAEEFRGVYWMNAADPASPSGLGIDGMDPRIPSRLGTSRICFRGSVPMALSRRNGRDLEVFVPPDDLELPAILDFVKLPRIRAVHPEPRVTVETVNRQSAAGSSYAAALKALGFVPDRGRLTLW